MAKSKTNLPALTGSQALVEYLMLHNTTFGIPGTVNARNAFYELERRVDADGTQAVYLRYGAMEGAQRAGGGARSVVKRGTERVCSEFIRERVSEKERRGYRIVNTDTRAKSLHDGTQFVSVDSIKDQRAAAARKTAREQKQAEITSELRASEKQGGLSAWVANALFS